MKWFFDSKSGVAFAIKVSLLLGIVFLSLVDWKSSGVKSGAPLALQRDWEESCLLNACIPSLQKNNYLEKKERLIHQARNALIYSSCFSNQDLPRICNLMREGRILSPHIGIYKRGLRNIEGEALVWEVSVLMGCDSCIVPTMPLDIHEEVSSFQPYVKIKNLKKFLPPGYPMKGQIAQADFWTASVFLFLVGHSDLNGTNVHYHKKGFLFVDNDSAFPEGNTPCLNVENELYLPILNSLIDLDLAYIPLNFEDLQVVQAFLSDLRSKREDIRAFLSLSTLAKSLSERSLKAFWERFNRITEYSLSEGMTHWDFARDLFPEHYGNAEKLCQMVKSEWGKELGPASSMCLVGPGLIGANISEEKKQRIREWVKANYSQ